MNIKYRKLGLSLIFVALLSNLMLPVSAVGPSLGVHNGDSFDFIVQNYSAPSPSDILLAVNDVDSTFVYAQQGDEFTITYLDATPYESLGSYFLDYEVTFKSQSFTNTQNVDILQDGDSIDLSIDANDNDQANDLYRFRSIDTFVVSNDWDAVIVEIESDFDERKIYFQQAFEAASTIFSLIDTTDEVGLKFEVDFSFLGGDGSVSVDFEIRLERSSGVLLYSSLKSVVKSTFEGETTRETGEEVLKRVNYSLPTSNDSSLLGFEFNTIFGSFLSIFTVILLRKRK